MAVITERHECHMVMRERPEWHMVMRERPEWHMVVMTERPRVAHGGNDREAQSGAWW